VTLGYPALASPGWPLTLHSNSEITICWQSNALSANLECVEKFRQSQHSIDNGQPTRCAYCGEPLMVRDRHVEAVKVGREYACDVFCAEALQDQPPQPLKARS
jgi:DNA-directed RNA polymerase subunit RPC12/RpoP